MEPFSDSSNEEILVLHVSQSFTVNPRSTGSIRVVLNASDKVRGSFRIFRAYGYGDKELKFKVMDRTEPTKPSQDVLLDLGTVENDASFDFTAGRSGDYSLEFDNEPGSSESNSQKEIQLAYEIVRSAITSRQGSTLFPPDRSSTA